MNDLDAYEDAMAEAGRTAERFAASLGDALADVALEGRSFEDAMRSLALSMAEATLNSALEPLETGAGDLLGRLASGLAGSLAGGVGGVVGGAGAGVDGLGAPGPGAFPPAPVTLNVSTPDAASFRRSEGQIAAMLARTAARGRRSL